MTPELYHILLKNVILFSRPIHIGIGNIVYDQSGRIHIGIGNIVCDQSCCIHICIDNVVIIKKKSISTINSAYISFRRTPK